MKNYWLDKAKNDSAYDLFLYREAAAGILSLCNGWFPEKIRIWATSKEQELGADNEKLLVR